MARLSRGIQVVQWHNDDKSKSVRYRVRIQRKTFKTDRLFDTVAEAEKFLADSKSDAGRKALTREDAEQSARAKQIKDLILSPPLSFYLDEWVKDCLPSEEDVKQLPETKRKARKVAISRISIVKKTEVEHTAGIGYGTGIIAAAMTLPKKPFGQFKLAEITPKAASAYIEARLATDTSPSTVKRDVGFLSSFFATWLPDFDSKAAENIHNPFAEARAKKRLKGADKRRNVRMEDFGEDAERRLFDELRACRNPQMLAIVGLALTTGMRRGEILGLTWDRVLATQIVLQAIDTKSGKPRRIPISQGAEKIFQAIGRKEGADRLFTYTADGFKSVWTRVRKRAGMSGFRFHDVRHEYVSSILELISSPVAAAAVAGYSSVKNFERQHVQPFKDRREIENGVQTERGLMLAVGHSDNRMTADYASKIASKVLRGAEAAAKEAREFISYPVVVETGDGVGVFAPDFGIFLACDTEEEALVKIAEAIIASTERPAPSSPMKVAKENQGALVRTVRISSAALVAADEA